MWLDQPDDDPSLLDVPRDTDADGGRLKATLMDSFRIFRVIQRLQVGQSLKPFMLLFDEY